MFKFFLIVLVLCLFQMGYSQSSTDSFRPYMLFPIEVHIYSSNPDAFFQFEKDVRSTTIIPRQIVRMSYVDSNRLQVELGQAFKYSVTNRTGVELKREGTLKSFIINIPDASNVHKILSLALGDVLVKGEFTPVMIEEVVERFNRGEGPKLASEYNSGRPVPELASLEALRFSVDLEKLGAEQGVEAEKIHIRTESFAKAHYIYSETQRAIPLESLNLEKLLAEQDPLRTRFSIVAEKIVTLQEATVYGNPEKEASLKDLPEPRRPLAPPENVAYLPFSPKIVSISQKASKAGAPLCHNVYR